MTKRYIVAALTPIVPQTITARAWIPPPESKMSQLLDFILTHEEAFKIRNRIASLYADFRHQLDTNPEGYHANIAAWKKALADAARAGVIPAQGPTPDLLNIRVGEELGRALQHPTFGRPTCLPVVFHDAVAKKEFMPLTDFVNSPTSVYKTSWVPSPWSVVRWGLKRIGVLGEPGFGNKLEVGSFVVLGNVEAAANEIIKQMTPETSNVDRILSRAEFSKRFARVLNPVVQLSSQDLNVLLVHMARDKQVLSYNGRTIKFKSENEDAPAPISEEDMAIANLRDTLAKFTAQLLPLEEKVAVADATAREAVKLKQNARAKAALRSKKMAESVLVERSNVVMQLEEVFHRLQQAADQVEIIEAMKLSAAALKGLNSKVGGAEGVTDVVDTLRTEMDTADEITNIINESAQHVDELEIDDEFEALEKAQKEKEEQKAKAEREEKEKVETAEREKREQEEALKTAARLAELDKASKELADKEKEKSTAETSSTEDKVLDQASASFARLSFVESSDKDDVEQEKEKERIPLPA
ncbi:Snf7-domain-containing protein [Dendryphion nanum]|uniref:Snf7-domain-containing protein n=1 Tax=Dendryphion nanum TaxID=256645 RepID=A0A9P9E4F2_9PLEO|nr:Snf7-domain-containing protein [Dendryphion nanum]